MNKQEFLETLRKSLAGLPKADIAERLAFYSEMIDDRKEEGLSESQAVLSVGSVEEIAAQVVAETPFTKIAKERIRPKRRLSTGEIVLLVLGSPIWLSLGIAAVSVIFALYLSFWAVVIGLWAVFVSFAACSIGSLLSTIAIFVSGNVASGLAIIAVAMVCAGLSIFVFFGCKAATKGAVILAKKIAIGIKNCFKGKEIA